MMHTRCPNTNCAYDMASAEVQEASEGLVERDGKARCPRCDTWMGNITVTRKPKEPERYVEEQKAADYSEAQAIDDATADEIQAELDGSVSPEEVNAEVPDDEETT